MDLGISKRVAPVLEEVKRFIEDEIVPVEHDYYADIAQGDRWEFTDRQNDIRESLKAKAREKGLWNFFLTDGDAGSGLNTVEYAYLAEEMGKSHMAAEIFNCAAPDTGNMEVLHKYGSEAQKKQWLEPLLNGAIRSAFAMTEPDVASSDATNIQTSIRREGGEYVINGRKWFITNAHHPDCRVFIVMGKTDFEADVHRQQSMVLVPMDTPGVKVVRNISTLNH